VSGLEAQRREALENYEDEVFEDLVLKQVLFEHKTEEALRDVVFSELGLRTRDIVKAKVKYLMDADLNARFEREVAELRDQLGGAKEAKELTEEQVLKAWRTYTRAKILKR